METQFRNTYDKASRMKGKPGENLLMLLEMRFDNIIYRMGLAASRAEARQLVTHGHFTVNGKKADIPSMQLAVGDVVEVRETSRKSAKFQELNGRNVPAWLTFNDEALKGTVAQIPGRDDVDLEVKETLIVELYSK
jgi:small subunit ribosomal protein S4